MYGSGPNSSDAYTINGLPGPLYPCSNKALNDELLFAVANHTLTVVEIDEVYTKPFTTTTIMVTPGQTTNVLLTANQVPDSTGVFVMSARPYLTSLFPFDNSTTIAFLKYRDTAAKQISNPIIPNNFLLHNLPKMEDTAFATQFSNNLRGLASAVYPCNVPKIIDKRAIITLRWNLQDCPANQTCNGYLGKKFYASMNNQSFIRPPMSILKCHHQSLSTSAYYNNFPERLPHTFNYTSVDPLTENLNTEFRTRLLEMNYGTNLEIVLQDTSLLNFENHPIHVHGHNFFIVGKGFGNFDAANHPVFYNLADPPERNTVAVPSGGWAAIRLKANNPGVWFIHCHLEEHTSWGLATGMLVKNASGPNQCL
ncbi:unnamed protein product [Camellia sinensis]